MAYRQSATTAQAREKSKREGKARAGKTKVTQVKGSKKALPKATFNQAAQRPAGGLGGLARRAKAAKKARKKKN